MTNSRRIDRILLAVTAFSLLCIVRCDDPRLTIQPPNAFFEANKQSFLMCSGKSTNSDGDDAFTDMKWLDPKGEDLNYGKFGIKKIGSSLKLSFENPTIEDSGYYNCTATYQNTDRLEVSKFVRFYEGITWEDCNSEQSVVLGHKGFISCKPIGNPKPIINWEKENGNIDKERLTIKPEGIEISEVGHGDTGAYSVSASVLETGHEESRRISISVHVPPKISHLEKEFYAIEGNEYSIQCEAEGFPKPIIKWFDPEMRDLGQMSGFTVHEDGTLIIHTVNQMSKGTYTCEAKNEAGDVTDTMQLYVLVKPVIDQFENITAEEGKSAILQCSAHGDPEPELTIRKDNNPEPFSDNQGDDIILSNSKDITNGLTILKLEIRHVSRDDDGLYYCAAKNNADRVEKVGHLGVLYAPDLGATPKKKVFAWPHHPGNLTCFVVANPNASISWRFRNEDIREDGTTYRIHSTNAYSNLMVDIGENAYDRDVFGSYSCVAKNTQGETSRNLTLAQGRAPDVLSQVVFNKVTPTSITFGFMGIQQAEEDNVLVTGIVVKYWIGRMEEALVKTHDWTIGSTYILDDLKPRTKYSFKFAARNDVGVGDFLSSQYEMPQERAPDSPQFITKNESISDFPDRFNIRWIIPIDNGEPIEYFEIRYYKVERGDDGWKQIGTDTITTVGNWENPEYELTSLNPGIWYRVELRAVNKIGKSFFDKGLVFMTRTGELNDDLTGMVPHGGLTLPVVIAIAVVAILLLLVILDVTSYLRFHCGVLYLMRFHTCGRSQSEKVKEAGLESGKSGVKEVSTANNGKIKTEIKLPSPVQDNNRNHAEEKSLTNGDNPAFENVVRPVDLIVDESFKNRSPKGSSIALGKSSPV